VLAVGITANSVQRGSVSWKRLREVLFATPAVGDGPETDASITRIEGAVRFEGVSLAREGRTLLDHVDLEVPKGQIVGITGRTGAGKSLLGALVGRLYDPTAGVVKIDGHDARAIPLAVLRRGLGMVPQEPFLFSDTLAENIGFGVPARTDGAEDAPLDPALIDWAAHVSGLDRDLSQVPEGYDTRVGERGVTLSGGQRQRAALARALARKPAILVLDDALSAVDTETEAAILSELEAALAHTTVLLISHRVSTLRRAHTIVVLDKGRVVERGTHDALVAHGGLYADLERRQRLASELAGELAAADDEAPAPAPSQGARGAR
jgi:ATP-binding cassette subfamily B protein